MIRVDIDNAAVTAALTRLHEKLGDEGMRPVHAAIGEALTESTKQRFVTSTGPDGTRWAQNAESVLLAAMRRASRGGLTAKRGGHTKAKALKALANKRPLVDSGELADTIHYQAIPGGVVVGTNRLANLFDEGAAVLHFGSKDGSIPARPFLGLSNEDERTILDIVEGFITGTK
jgi:phage gpG-like protein